jgi:hypothetical protein
MSPKLYSSLGKKYNTKKHNLWLIIFVYFIVITGTTVFSETINTILPFQVPLGIALLILILTWGVLLAVYWYGPEGKLEPRKIASHEGVKRKLGCFMSWYGSIFLTLWFLSGIIVLPWFLMAQVQN